MSIEELQAELETVKIELDEARAELVAEQRENTRFREWYRNAFGGSQKRETPWEVCNCEQCRSLRRMKETP